MKNEFEVLCESVNTTLKQTKIFRYPKQIRFSEEFTKALCKEVSRHMSVLDESQQPIRDLPEKFLKALKFELTELTEKKIGKTKEMTQVDYMRSVRKPTGGVEKVHGKGKKAGYDRAREKKEWKAEA